MTRQILAIVTGIALAASATACGDDDDGSSGGLRPEEIPGRVATSYCHLIDECTADGDDNLILAALLTRAECETIIRRQFERNAGLRALIADVEAGVLTYDGATAARCLETVASSCVGSVLNDPFATNPDCRRIFHGDVPEGGDCMRNEHCAGDAQCDTEGAVCPGTCAARRPLGAECGSDQDCSGEGLQGTPRCLYEGASGHCIQILAMPDAAASQPCGKVSETIDSETYAGCMPGLWCQIEPELDRGTCLARLAAGASCEDIDTPCVDGHVCLPVEGGGNVCQPLVVIENEGDVCNQIVFCDPVERLVCGETGRCERVGDGSMGSPCFTNDLQEFLGCDDGLFCQDDETSMGTCVPVLDLGAPCDRNEDCESGICEGDPQQVCVAVGCT